MNRWHRRTLSIFVGMSAVFASSCTEPNAVDTQLTQVRVAQTGDFLLYAGLYIAVDQGFFEAEGLEVAISNTGGDQNSVASVLSGSAEFGIGDPAFAAIAANRGQDTKVVGVLVEGVPFWGLTYDEEVVQNYQEYGLEGLRVATFPSPSTAYTLQLQEFQKRGLTPTIVQGAFGSLNGILETGNADIALDLEPNVSQAVSRGATVLYSLAEEYPDFLITGITVRGDYVIEERETVLAFLEALDDAFDYMRAETGEATGLLQRRFPEVPAEVVADAVERMLADGVIPMSTEPTLSGWNQAVALRVGVGDLPAEFDAGSVLQPVSPSADE
ncbi:MAG: ABC transporter substrate-binding protein [Oceanicaulis sp.]